MHKRASQERELAQVQEDLPLTTIYLKSKIMELFHFIALSSFVIQFLPCMLFSYGKLRLVWLSSLLACLFLLTFLSNFSMSYVLFSGSLFIIK